MPCLQLRLDRKIPMKPPQNSAVPVCFSRNEAEGLAIRVEDAMRVTASLLDGAEATTEPGDWKRKTLIIMARDRNRHLEHVALMLRGGGVQNEPKTTESALENASPKIGDVVLPAVEGRMECSNAEFERRCLVRLAAEQKKIFPDNDLISLLADGARLAREYSAEMNQL